MALTDTAIRHAKPADKPQRLSDEKGLYLLLNPNGSKWWRLDYRFIGTRKTLSLGVYPDVGLKDARERRDQARKLIAQGVDPGEQRKAQKQAIEGRAANSFEVICLEWLEHKRSTVAEGQYLKAFARMNKDAIPWLDLAR